MNIVILAGGTGSIALQTGLNTLITKEFRGVDVKVIVNAYDNGLSTGAVRKALGGKILGPSDVRKNQTTLYKLAGGAESCINNFLDHRFTVEANKARQYCWEKMNEMWKVCSPRADRRMDIIQDGINFFFASPGSQLIDYDDFSIANVVYAGLAAKYNNSLRIAASVMADFLGIPDNVLVNDDKSLFLGAITKSGKRITDEGDIVSWNNPDDPIIDVFFVDANGVEAVPHLNQESKKAIEEADVVIMSSGTQWSSLIPTYASVGFREAIEASKAKVLMVMNRVPDKDAPNQTASDIVQTIVPKYFPEKRVNVIVDYTGHDMMKTIDEKAEPLLQSVNYFRLGRTPLTGEKLDSKHIPENLAAAVLKTIYKDVLDAEAYVFDYDDTLVGRGNTFKDASNFNVSRIAHGLKNKKFMICTGNTIKAIHLPQVDSWLTGEDTLPITVFADGGINEYSYDPLGTAAEDQRRFHFVRCLDEAARFDSKGPYSIENVTTSLCAAGIPAAKFENRGDVMVSIKPIDPEYRLAITNLVKHVCGSAFEVKATGRTTIEINKKEVSKDVAVMEVLKRVSPIAKVVYIGDELKSGNDAPVAELAKQNPRIVCHEVKNPADTALLLLALFSFSNPSFSI
jgi:2-phospho-L-lactate transferase/gluconeogenesis factor (CofD/UPF0052 family)